MVKPIKPKFSLSFAVSFLSFLLPLLFINNSWAQEQGQKRTHAEIDTSFEMFENPNQHYFSLKSPKRSPSKAVPASLKVHKNQERHVFSWIALVLGSIGPEAGEIVFALIEALQDEEVEVRRRATSALLSIGGKVKEDAVPALIEALKDEDSQVRSGAAYALGSIGSEAQDTLPAIIPALIKALKDEDRCVRCRAASALEGIGANSKECLRALIEALKDKEDNVRIHAASAIGSIGAEAKEAVPALIETLKDKGRFVRSFTADALVQIAEDLRDKKDMSSIPMLQTILEALKENEAEFAGKIQFVRRNLEAFNFL
ncbi:MAG TPA: hypothetical protein DCE56_09535, partial [Cyanobacteria bacterium UBA8553]|nr:hypothetical protein [Cyanobacteria bacterium UBA8553]